MILLWAACGEGDGSGDDAGIPHDAVPADAMTSAGTEVSGILDGAPFTLRYAVVKWPVPGDPRTMVCVANIPLTYPDCERSMMPERKEFLGPFVFDASGQPRWGLAETLLVRVGPPFPLTQLAWSGTLTVSEYDPPSGLLRLTMDVLFDEGSTAGTVAVGGSL